MSPINQGLLITAIGMGLVFLAIVLLWGLMALMVRLGSRLDRHASGSPPETIAANKPEPGDDSSDIRKRQAAAASVAFALAKRANKSHKDILSSEITGNAWQTAQRAQVLQGKTNIFTSRSSRR